MRRPSMRRPLGIGSGPWLRLGIGMALGLLASCLLEIDSTVACGDGYVDEDAGEECDPAVPSSYEDACNALGLPNGRARCDPMSCTIDTGDCLTCGNGVVQPELGEECDPGEIESITGERECSSLPPLGEQPYTYGSFGACQDDCTFGRSGCSYCGNGVLDDALELDTEGNRSPNEWCDGTKFDESRIASEIGSSVCYAEDPDLRPVVTCADNCLGIAPATTGPVCCVARDRRCPIPSSGRKCCFEIDNPQLAGPYCHTRGIDGGEELPLSLCR